MSILNLRCENVKTQNITDELLRRIFEIEQDMWSRWIWEYIKCDDCNKIYSKSDVYWSDGLSPVSEEVSLETVSRIEEIMWYASCLPQCKDCWWHTSHIYNIVEYIWEMRKRYNHEDAFLTVAQNGKGQEIWFMDAYITTLREIFDSELAFHFSEDVLDEIMRRYDIDRDTDLLTFSSLWTDDKHKSLHVIFELIRKFFSWMEEKYDEISAIFESIIWSTTYCIFNVMWAEAMQCNKNPRFLSREGRHNNIQTDILFQRWLVKRYKNRFNIRTRDVLIYSKSQDLISMYA